MKYIPIVSLYLLFTLFSLSCQSEAGIGSTSVSQIQWAERIVSDPHSCARPQEAVTEHLSLHLTVNFDSQTLHGFAQWKIENRGTDQIVFDTKGLEIERVTIGPADEETTYQLGEPDPLTGTPLTVFITPETELVTIHYATTPEGAAALDWLEPQQTADKKLPFLFTQGQAILTRTWIPCQDSPGIRITYDARIEVPQGMLAVMSAENPRAKNDSGIYTFKMPQPIPPYLLALAAGDLQFAAIGERTGVYAEPSVLEDAAYEFADMEKMLETAEALYGPYLWGRYDVIVLPPSFPFGGMENPRLTFATPTIIAGDRSLTALIAHELAHSWSGNLVTNATWNDFWLNEGFTVYFERRIMEALYGKDYADMLALLGYQDLQATVQDLGIDNPDTALKLELKGRDPDEGMTDIAYEKGAHFLTLLEQKAGRASFDAFLKQYFESHQFQSITTESFIDYLQSNLLHPGELNVSVEEWVYEPGIPENIPVARSERFALVDEQLERLSDGLDPRDLKGTDQWSTHEWLHFIRQLPDKLDLTTMEGLDNTFGFSNSGNSEILAAWFERAIRNGYAPRIESKIEDFLIRIGRRKFLTPLYRAYKESGELLTAQRIYQEARPRYHSVSRGTMDELLD